jgi:hypothetical protein
MTPSNMSRRDVLAAGAGLAAGAVLWPPGVLQASRPGFGIELNERLVRAHLM